MDENRQAGAVTVVRHRERKVMCLLVASVTVAMDGCSRQRPRGRTTAAVVAVGEVPREDSAVHDSAPRGVRSSFAPRWACKIVGPGRAGRGPQVSVPVFRPGGEGETFTDHITLHDGRTLVRSNRSDGGRVDPDRAEVSIRDAHGVVVASRTYRVRTDAVEMLFEDARGAGVAWFADDKIIVERIGETGEELLIERAGDITRACVGPVTDSLRLVPIGPRPWAFPPVTGTPPLVADARWTLSRDARGVCVARLEGEGPWGRVLLQAGDAGMQGELSLAESVNPVTCGPQP